MSILGWSRVYYDPQDSETVRAFWADSRYYWKTVTEGDIYTEGPFVGLVAH